MSLWFIATCSYSYPSFLTKFGTNSCEKSLQYSPFIISLSLPFSPAAEIIPCDASTNEPATLWDEAATASDGEHVPAGLGEGEDTRPHLVCAPNPLSLNYTVRRQLIAP